MSSPTPITLSELGQRLLTGIEKLKDKDAEAALRTQTLKDALMRCRDDVNKTSVVVSCENDDEVADALLFLVTMSFFNKRKDELIANAKSLETQEQLDFAQGIEKEWKIRTLSRKAKDEFKIEKNSGKPYPASEFSGKKICEGLQQGWFAELVRQADLMENSFEDLAKVASGRFTHPIRVAVDGSVASGGLTVGALAPDVFFRHSLSEADYAVAKAQALTGSAGDQQRDWILLTLVQRQGKVVNFYDMLVEDSQLRERIAHKLTKMQVPHAELICKLLENLRSDTPPALNGANEFFVTTDRGVRAFAPSIAVCVFDEIDQARSALNAMYVQEQEEAQDRKIAAAQEAARLAELAGLKGKVEIPKKEKISGLYFPRATLPIGGSKPQNVASGLSTAIHGLQVFTKVRPMRNPDAAERRVFRIGSVLRRPRIELKSLPGYLVEDAVDNFEQKQRRERFFSILAVECLEGLIDTRDKWLDDKVMSEQAKEALENNDSAYAEFVKGSDVVGFAAKDKFAPLVRDICRNINEALTSSFKDTSFAKFNSHLQDTVAAVVERERA